MQYVYDALLCEEKDKPVVIEAMNRIILEYGIKTIAKLIYHNQILFNRNSRLVRINSLKDSL